jgi:hypothetical protein
MDAIVKPTVLSFIYFQIWILFQDLTLHLMIGNSKISDGQVDVGEYWSDSGRILIGFVQPLLSVQRNYQEAYQLREIVWASHEEYRRHFSFERMILTVHHECRMQYISHPEFIDWCAKALESFFNQWIRDGKSITSCIRDGQSRSCSQVKSVTHTLHEKLVRFLVVDLLADGFFERTQ